jgi:hypothetical protein
MSGLDCATRTQGPGTQFLHLETASRGKVKLGPFLGGNTRMRHVHWTIGKNENIREHAPDHEQCHRRWIQLDLAKSCQVPLHSSSSALIT